MVEDEYNEYRELKEEAEKIGNLVLEKIKNKKLPSITLQELDSFKITK